MTKFKTHPDFPGYRIGSDGTIWSRWRRGGGGGPNHSWLQRKDADVGHGHRYLFLRHRDGKLIRVLVHRIVLEVFKGPCPKGMQSLHKNGVPWDNRARNLRWGTPKENAQDSLKHRAMPVGERHPNAKLTAKQVAEIRRRRSERQIDLAIEFGVSRSAISSIQIENTWAFMVRRNRFRSKKCSKHGKDGRPCSKFRMPGMDVCNSHRK